MRLKKILDAIPLALLTTGTIACVAAVAAIVVLGVLSERDERLNCEAKGGARLRTANGYQCLAVKVL